jgi:hypothetical protein
VHKEALKYIFHSSKSQSILNSSLLTPNPLYKETVIKQKHVTLYKRKKQALTKCICRENENCVKCQKLLLISLETSEILIFF